MTNWIPFFPGATASQDIRGRTANRNTFPAPRRRARTEAHAANPRPCPTNANVHLVRELGSGKMWENRVSFWERY